MKKLATWICKLGQQFRSKSRQDWRSHDRLSSGMDSRQSDDNPKNHRWDSLKESLKKTVRFALKPFDNFNKNKAKNTETPINDGLIEKFNQRYLKLPQPYARYLKPFIITVSLIAAYAVLGFYLLPTVLKSKIPSIIQEETGRKATVANIDFNPFKLIANIQGFKILEKNGKPFVGFDSFMVDINAFQSIKQLALVIDDIALNKPTVRLAKLKDGKFNFADMAKPTKKEEPKKPDDGKLFPLNIIKLSIKEGKLSWDDQHFAKPVSEEVSPINLTVNNLSTEANAKGKLDFNLALKSGGKLDWKASLGVNPVASEGGLKLDKVQLQKALALALSDTAGFDLKGNELFNVDYKVDMDKKNLKVNIKKSRIELQDFQFADNTADKNLLKIPSLTIETDGMVTMASNDLDVVAKKMKLASRDLQFSNQASDPISVSIPAFSHETDITVNQTKDELKVAAKKATVAIKNLLFNGINQRQVEAKIPELTLETAYNLAINPKAKDIHVSHGKFDFHDLLLAEKEANATLLKIPAFALSDMDVDLKNREVKIASITSKAAEFQAWLNPDGSLNYQKLIPTAEGKKVEATQPNYATAKTVDFKEDVATATTVASAAAEPVKPEKDWLLNINTLELIDYAINFEDKSLKKPAKMTAKPINLKVSNISNKADAKLPFNLAIGLNKTGLIKLKGETVVSPLSAAIDLDVKEIGLKDFQPYVEKFARLYVLDGKFNIDGNLAIKQTPNKPMDVKFKGNTGIASLLTRDKIQNKDFIKWKNLMLKNLDVDLLANRYSASTLLIEKPFAKVTIRKDKTINFSDIMIADKGDAKSTNPAKSAKPIKVSHSKAAKTEKPVFKLAKVKIVDGSSDFADLSLILPFAAQIESLDGGAEGISSDQKSTIKVDLKGSAYDLAPVDINGEISPYLGNYDVSLKFDGLPMPLVTPYMVQFSGYKIEKGKLTLGLKYQIEKGKLNASNNILIDQLELGEKVDNPDAVSLPLELAIALLKDSSGKIKLDVPITGSLEDPQFSVAGLVFDALVNVLTKIVTSPFNAIASLVGSEENLSVVGFASGKKELDAKEMKKLDDVAKALKEKPVLNLEIKGASFEKDDWPVLREDALMDKLKATKAAELSKEEEKNVRIEQVKLSEDDYNDLLADAFIEKFPNLAEKSLIGTPKLKNSDSEDFYKVAKRKMSEIIKPEPKRLKDLASDRAQAIAKYLVQKAGIPHERVFILDSAIDPKREGKDIVSALSLKTN